jgi:hypothetical protein
VSYRSRVSFSLSGVTLPRLPEQLRGILLHAEKRKRVKKKVRKSTETRTCSRVAHRSRSAKSCPPTRPRPVCHQFGAAGKPARFWLSDARFRLAARVGFERWASTSCARGCACLRRRADKGCTGRECNRGSLFVCQVPTCPRGPQEANTGFPQDHPRSIAKARPLTRPYEGGILFAHHASSQRHSAGERCGAGLTVTSLADTSSGCPVNPGPSSCSASTAVSDPPAGASSPGNRDRKRPASFTCHGSG